MKTLVFLLLFAGYSSLAQTATTTTTTTTAPSYIEVTGMAEMEVTPDEIYIQFHLKEYEKDRIVQTIDKQEQDLTVALQAAGLDMDSIDVSDFESNYVRVNWAKKEYRQEKRYDFKVSTIQETAKVFEVFERMEVRNAHISRVDHSAKHNYEADMRIAATKDAKNKANEMLNAIGQEAGQALYIKENTLPIQAIEGVNMDYKTYGEMSTMKGGAIVQYKKMRIVSQVTARFTID